MPLWVSDNGFESLPSHWFSSTYSFSCALCSTFLVRRSSTVLLDRIEKVSTALLCSCEYIGPPGKCRIFGSVSCMPTSSTIIRRQQVLIRSLGGFKSQANKENMCGSNNVTRTISDADFQNIVRRITPTFDLRRHKGQAGNVAVIGGCREYTGAPYFSAISALKLGVDLSHVFCTKDAATVIKSYSPELIVHPVLEESYSIRDEDKEVVSAKVLAEVTKWMERFDCLVIGPGLGRDSFLLDCVSEIIRSARQSNVPIVLDGDGLFLVTNNLALVRGYPLAILTPNVNEYKRLIKAVLDDEVNDEDAAGQLLLLAKWFGGATILKKGASDLISDGQTVNMVNLRGSPRRCGGQGDILSGSVAVFSLWARQQMTSEAEHSSDTKFTNPLILGSIAASVLLRKAASLAFEKKKRSTLTSDIIECLGESLESVCPA